jgi:hypothetical protein
MGIGKIIDDNMEAKDIPNSRTLKALLEAKEGKTIKCVDFEDYLKKVQ